MIIKPGVDDSPVATMIELVHTNSKRRIDVTLQDSNGVPQEVSERMLPDGEPDGELDLKVTDLNSRVIYSESYYPTDAPDQRRIKKTSTGRYYLNFGEVATETQHVGAVLFNWHARKDEASEDSYRTQVLEIVSPRILSLLPTFRLMIDKTLKRTVPEKYCFLGYTDGILISYLKLGLSMINSFQPYPTFIFLDEFPIEMFSEILIKAALYQGLMSQTLFSIDVDVPSFNDQGRSFVLQHATPLAAFVNGLRAELEKDVPGFKRHLVSSGSIGLELNMNAAAWMLLSTSPSNSLYFGLYVSR